MIQSLKSVFIPSTLEMQFQISSKYSKLCTTYMWYSSQCCCYISGGDGHQHHRSWSAI